MKHIIFSMLTATLLSGAAWAAEPAPSVVSGGVGEDGQLAIEQVQHQYNTKLVFTGEGGFFLADVNVIIRDTSGREVVNGNADGPILLAALKPGKYTVEAEASGYTKKRSITVGTSLRTYGISFPIRDEIPLDTHILGNSSRSYDHTSSYGDSRSLDDNRHYIVRTHETLPMTHE